MTEQAWSGASKSRTVRSMVSRYGQEGAEGGGDDGGGGASEEGGGGAPAAVPIAVVQAEMVFIVEYYVKSGTSNTLSARESAFFLLTETIV